MSFLHIVSKNPNLSYVLVKNPETIKAQKKPFKRELRKGVIYGWYSDKNNQSFKLLFIDSDTQNSFSEREEFEYLDLTRYSDPYVVTMMITTALDSALNDECEYDVESETSIKFPIKIPQRISSRLTKIWPGEFEENSLIGPYCVLTITAKTVKEALSRVVLTCLAASLASETSYVPLNQDGIKKYLRILNAGNSDFYLRHLIVSRAITNRHLFDKLKDEINPGKDFVLKYGNTQMQRFDAISWALGEISKNKTLIDIGCGEMFHSMKLADKYAEILGFEKNPEIVEVVSGKLLKREILHASITQQETNPEWVLENKDMFSGADVLATEVFEHIEKEDASKLLAALLDTDFDNLVITLPNKDFNKFYGIADDEFRHPDHKWEPTATEWISWVASLMQAANVKRKTDGRVEIKIDRSFIGDSVMDNGEMKSVSLLAKFSPVK